MLSRVTGLICMQSRERCIANFRTGTVQSKHFSLCTLIEQLYEVMLCSYDAMQRCCAFKPVTGHCCWVIDWRQYRTLLCTRTSTACVSHRPFFSISSCSCEIGQCYCSWEPVTGRYSFRGRLLSGGFMQKCHRAKCLSGLSSHRSEQF